MHGSMWRATRMTRARKRIIVALCVIALWRHYYYALAKFYCRGRVEGHFSGYPSHKTYTCQSLFHETFSPLFPCQRLFQLLQESNVVVNSRPVVILLSSIFAKQQTPEERYPGLARKYYVNPAIWRDYFRITTWKATQFSVAFVCNLTYLTGIIWRVGIRTETGFNRYQ